MPAQGRLKEVEYAMAFETKCVVKNSLLSSRDHQQTQVGHKDQKCFIYRNKTALVRLWPFRDSCFQEPFCLRIVFAKGYFSSSLETN